MWSQWRRWRDKGTWAQAMRVLAKEIHLRCKRKADPTVVMIDAQTVKVGGAGPTFHEAGGRGGYTRGAKRTILIEILGLPLAVAVEYAKPHDLKVGRELLAERLPTPPAVQAVVGDRGYRGLAALPARRHVKLDIKAPPKGTVGFTPLAPLYKVEHAFAQLGRWRRLARCYEGTAASARAWLEVASFGYLLGRV